MDLNVWFNNLTDEEKEKIYQNYCKAFIPPKPREDMEDKALTVCKNFSNSSFWKIVRELEKIGISTSRAKRMSRQAQKGIFLWKGKKEPLF